MTNISTAISILKPDERRSALLLLPLICVRGFADMLGVAMIFPFLKVLNEPEVVTTNPWFSRVYAFGNFDSPDSFVVWFGIAFIVILLGAEAIKILTIYAVNRWLEGRKHTLSTRLLTTYLRQPYEFMLNRHSSELIANMLSEVARIANDVYKALLEAVISFVTLVFMIVLLLVVDPVVTLLATGFFAGLYAVLFVSVRRIALRLGTIMTKANRKRTRIAWEALAGGKQVRLLNRERSLAETYRPPSLAFAKATALSRLVVQAPRYIIELAAIGGTVLLILVLVSQRGGVGSDSMASILPILGVFVLAVYRMMPAFQNGYAAIISLRIGRAAVAAVHDDLAEGAHLPPLPRAGIEPLRFHRTIEFRNVSYAYPGTDTPSLSNVNLTIPAAASVGIVGPTGAGKSTLMDLILGLIEPTDGEILIDGVKLDHRQMRAWRANVGYVPQDIFLGDASIAQNIAFGVPEDEIDLDRVRETARMAQIDAFIASELPAGFDTLVGERGVRLSGGQRQRISIARALYTEPEVIAFDEATSALDNDTENLVMEEISKLAGTRTIIMVAHRLTTVKDCDMIVTLSWGRVESIGSYSDLIGSDIALPRAASGRC